ncbi:hypothetical protein JW960_16235 [candidate division KSB1 bacterium]|nr:hypothetical protein [candidate division KSB1 bacterium]
MKTNIRISQALSKRDLKQVVTFPWKIYSEDPYWVPPLISSQLHRLDKNKNPFFSYADADVFYAEQDGNIVGTIVPWINHRTNSWLNKIGAGFGYFETINSQPVTEALIETAVRWAKERNAIYLRGPLYFSPQDSPGVVITGFDTLPAPMVGHTPAYYPPLLESLGFRKHRDAFAYEIDLSQFNGRIENIPHNLQRIASIAEMRYNVQVRPVRMDKWDDELQSALYIFNEALGYQREGVPMADTEFLKMANDLRRIIDPDLICIAEVDGQPVGLYVVLPNVNELLKQLNGHVFPFGWMKLLRPSKYMNTVSTKILGVLDGYRNKGVDALMYRYVAEQMIRRGYKWMDFSLMAEENQMANRIIQRFGATVYKICRTYHMDL